jgi:hypothetical protein
MPHPRTPGAPPMAPLVTPGVPAPVEPPVLSRMGEVVAHATATPMGTKSKNGSRPRTPPSIEEITAPRPAPAACAAFSRHAGIVRGHANGARR